MEAIEKGDKQLFQKLGGGRETDINFEITSEGIFPLLIVCARGDFEMVSIMLQNSKLEVNKTDGYGVNAFWIAAFYGHCNVRKKYLKLIKIMKLLASRGAEIRCKN